MIQLFDSLAHPTLTGNWFTRTGVAGFETLVDSMKAHGVAAACAIGMAHTEEYEHQAFIEQCKPHSQLVPIAGFDPHETQDIPSHIATLKHMGYKGLKLHPRFSNVALDSTLITETFNAAAKHDLPVIYCTYYHSKVATYPSSDPFYLLLKHLKAAPDCKVILAHGGGVELMRYAELVRFNPNLLLDLSYTLCKYAGSSLDLDIAWLFKHLDQRICIGSDFPEITQGDMRKRFEHYAKDLAQEKVANIAYKNLSTILNHPLELA